MEQELVEKYAKSCIANAGGFKYVVMAFSVLGYIAAVLVMLIGIMSLDNSTAAALPLILGGLLGFGFAALINLGGVSIAARIQLAGAVALAAPASDRFPPTPQFPSMG